MGTEFRREALSRSTLSLEELSAAYLSEPWRAPPVELSWSACDAERLLEVLRQNRVPLASVPESRMPRALQEHPALHAARQAEDLELGSQRAEYQSVYDALARYGISGVFIKSVGAEPSFPFKSDNLDILYRPQDTEQVRSVLQELGYVELKNMEEPHKYLFRKFRGGRSVCAIHVHEHVGWMVSFLDESRLWQRCRQAADDPALLIPAPEDALLTNLAHWFYEDKRLTLQDAAKCAYCVRQGVDWDEVYRIASWRGWSDGLSVALLLYAFQDEMLYGSTAVPASVLERAWRNTPAWARLLLRAYSQGRAAVPLRIPFLFSKLFFYAKLVRDPTRSIARKIKDLAVHTAYGIKLRLHIHSQPSFLVTLSGIDGCGKTTQARALQSAFRICHLRADNVWMRGGSARWIALLTRLTRSLAKRPNEGPLDELSGTEAKIRRRQERLRSPGLRSAWAWLTAIELMLQYTWRVTLPLLRGRVIICDRYMYDALADWSAYFEEPAIERRMQARVLRFLLPRPDISFWLDVPIEVAQSRSQDDLPSDFLSCQRVAYERLNELHRFQRLDGSVSSEEISAQVAQKVLGAYFASYRTWVNELFFKNPGQWR